MLPVPVLMLAAGIDKVVPATAVSVAFAARDNAEIVRALASRSETEVLEELTVTPPPKSLDELSSVIAAPPASNTVVPVTITAPPAWEIAPLAVSDKLPLITAEVRTAAPVCEIVTVPEARLRMLPNDVACVASVIPVAEFALKLVVANTPDPEIKPALRVMLPEPLALIVLEKARVLVLLAPPIVLSVID